jgi:hypothetical protein
MNIESLYQKLIEAVRSRPADDRAPYAFEQRIMARLRELPQIDLATLWGRSLWRAAIPFACVALAITIWTQANAPTAPAPVYAEAQLTELDEVLLAPLVNLEAEDASW